jgi:hypothetical protein
MTCAAGNMMSDDYALPNRKMGDGFAALNYRSG